MKGFKIFVFATITIALLIPTVYAEQVKLGVDIYPQSVYEGGTAKVSINVSGASESQVQTIPVDVMLVMDCSGSMYRYGNIISGPYNVTLKTSWRKIGEFRLNKTSNVEVMLQTLPGRGLGADWYVEPYDLFEVYLKNKDEGWTTPIGYGYSVVRYIDVPPGNYEVYAKLYYYDRYYTQPNRVFAIELPPVRIDSAKQSAKAFVDILKENDRVGLVRFGEGASLLVGLTSNKNYVKRKIDRLYPDGGTPMGDALKLAINHLIKKGRSNAVKVILLFTDGWWNEGCNPIKQAYRAKRKGIIIYTIGWGAVNDAELKKIAEITGGKYYYATTSEELRSIYEKLAKRLSNITAKNVRVEVNLNNNVEYSNPSVKPSGNGLVWDIGTLSENETWNVSFNVKPLVDPNTPTTYNIGDVVVSYSWNGRSMVVSKPLQLTVIPVKPESIVAEANRTTINELETVRINVSVFTNEELSGKVAVRPKVLNVNGGKFTVFIFDTNVDTGTITITKINGESVNVKPLWAKRCGIKTIAKFDRSDVRDYLSVGYNTFTVSWRDTEGNYHEGSATVKVVNNNQHGCNCHKKWSKFELSGERYNLTWSSSEELNDTNTKYVNFNFDEETLTGTLIWTPSQDFVKHPKTSDSVTFTFYLKDENGNVLNSTSITITVNNIGRTSLQPPITPTPTPTPPINPPSLDNVKPFISGSGPYVGEPIYIYIINETYYKEHKDEFSNLKGAIKIYVNVTDVTSENAEKYYVNVTVNTVDTVNGVEIYNDTLEGLIDNHYLKTVFVPMKPIRYDICANIFNSTKVVGKGCTNVSVGVRKVT